MVWYNAGGTSWDCANQGAFEFVSQRLEVQEIDWRYGEKRLRIGEASQGGLNSAVYFGELSFFPQRVSGVKREISNSNLPLIFIV